LDKAASLAYKAIEKSLPEKEKVSVERVAFAVIDGKGFRNLSLQEVKQLVK
jgi:hypothetical protein